MKRITAILLSVIMIFSFVPVSFAETTEADGSGLYQTEIGFLSEIGLLPDGFSADSPMSRGAFAKMVTDLIYNEVDVSAAHETSFTDLQFGSDYYNAVGILEGLNIVKGTGSNTFRPDDQIACQDALVIALKIMGYEPVAAANGGYPSGYFYTANKAGLLRDVKIISPLDMKTAAKIVYNMLFVSNTIIEAINDDGIELGINYASNYLSDRLGIIKYSARILNDGMVSYDDNMFLDGQVVLENLSNKEKMTVYCSDPSVGEFFGCYLDAFVKYDDKSGRAELIYCAPKSNVKIMTIDAEDIENTTLNVIEYQDNPQAASNKTANIASENVAYFKNGIRLTQASSADLKPVYGNVTLIYNFNDTKADVVIVNDIKSNITVNSFSANTTTLVCRDNPVNSLDLSDESSVKYRVYKDGKITDLSAIKEGNIVSVAPAGSLKDGYQMYFLYLSEKTVTGILSSTDEGEKAVYIDDAEYKLSSLYFANNQNVFSSLVVSEKITIYIDYLGNVAYIEGVESDNINYAYLLNVTQKNAFDDIRIILYSKYGAFSNHIVSKNVVIDGKRLDGKAENGSSVSMKEEIVELLNLSQNDKGLDISRAPTPGESAAHNQTYTEIAPRLAIIKVNTNGQIYYIDTDYPTHKNDPDLEKTDAYVLTSGERYYRTERLYVSTQLDYATPNGSFLVDRDTTIMQVPDVDRNGMPSTYPDDYVNVYELSISELSNYKLLTFDELDTYQFHDMQPYNIDPKTGIADILLFRGYHDYGESQNEYIAASQFVVFKKISKYYSEDKNDGDYYKIRYVAQDGTEGSIIVNRDILLPYYDDIIFGNAAKNIEPLSLGDVIFFKQKNGILHFIGRLINFSQLNDMYVDTGASGISNDPYTNPLSSTVTIPYDAAKSTTFRKYSATYNFGFGAAESVNGTIVKCLYPYSYADSAKSYAGTFNDYYNYDMNCMEKYVPFDLAMGNIIVVEETKCNSASGKECHIIIRKGTIDDIKPIEAFASDGFRKSSKIFGYNQVGVLKNAVIFNLSENHDK